MDRYDKYEVRKAASDNERLTGISDVVSVSHVHTMDQNPDKQPMVTRRGPRMGWEEPEGQGSNIPTPGDGGRSPSVSRNNIEGVKNPAFQRESSSVDDRIPRYRRSFISYEDIIKNIDEDDPFKGEPPPPKKERMTRAKTTLGHSSALDKKSSIQNRQHDSSDPAQHVERSSHSDGQTLTAESVVNTINMSSVTARSVKIRHQDSASRKHRKHRHDARNTKNNNAKVTQGSNVPKVKGQGQAEEEETKSNHTYILGETDSKTKLIDGGHTDKQVKHENAEVTISPRTLNIDSLRPKKFREVMREDAIARYIHDNFQHRQCNRYAHFVKKDKAGKILEERCQCGRDEEWHHEESIPVNKNTASDKWTPSTHSAQIEADSFGRLQFCGFGQETSSSKLKSAPYVRVNFDTDLEKVWTLLSEYWHLEAPKLLISVTGGAKRFYLKDRLRCIFKRGLINAATSTGAWIITGGTNAGVMQFVGEAIREHLMTIGSSDQKIVALGIATWGVVDNKESLIGEPGKGCFPATYNIEDLNTKEDGVSPLDVNHTHFILVDDGREKKFGGEIKLRASLEQYIAEKLETGVAVSHKVHVPVVLLVLEGGENTLKTVKQSIDRKIPVVVIQGSGRAADFIAYAYKRTKNKNDEDDWSVPQNFDAELEQRAHCLFDFSKETDKDVIKRRIQTCIYNVMECVKHRKMITVFHLEDADSSKEIDQAILYALLKANKSDASSQLALALAWNRCDIARQEIFTVENRARWQGMNLYDAMFTALVQDRVDFVQLFLDNGVELKKFLTVRTLRDLYAHVVNAGTSADLLRHLLQQVQQSWKSYLLCCQRNVLKDDLRKLLPMVGRVYTYLLGDQSANPYGAETFVVNDDQDAQSNEMGLVRRSHDPKVTMVTETGTSTQETSLIRRTRSLRNKPPVKSDFESPEKQLFLWAILLNRRDLSLLFWKLGKDHIGGALIGSAVLKSLANEADREEEIDLSADLYSHSQEYEAIAVGVLSECYQRDKPTAHKLLVRSLVSWGGTTCLTIADAAEQMNFMGHSSTQTKLNRIWKGKMALYTSTWKILLSLFLPFFISIIKFSTNDYVEDSYAEDQFVEDEAEKVKSSSNQVEPTDGHFHRSKTRRLRKRLTRKLYYVTCTGLSENTINIFKALGYYYTAPVTKFMYHTLSQLIFLALFSFFVLTDLRPITKDHPPNLLEIITWGWAATLLIEEFRQVLTREPKSLKYKLSGYFSSVWNRFDQLVYLMFIVSIILRFSLPPETFIWARMFYSVTLAMYYLRFMHVFFVAKNIGPKVIMIRRMLTDLLFFICILAVFILSYGVASHALRFPNSVPSWKILKDVIYLPYWQMYGELFLDQLEGHEPGCTRNATIYESDPSVPRCPEETWLVLVLFVFYMIMTNILLLNLLIAMFSYTFEKVQENSEKVWRFYRYTLIYEYFDRPALAPPLIILTHIYRAVRLIIQKCRNTESPSTDFSMHLDEEEYNKLTSFERAGMENYLLRTQVTNREQISVKVTNTGQRIEKVIEDLEEIKDQIRPDDSLVAIEAKPSARFIAPASLEPTSGIRQESYKEDLSIIHSRLSGLEEQLANQTREMSRLMCTLKEMTAASNR